MTATALLDGDARAAWLAERRTGIGSSDAAAIALLDPYKSALEVYLEKIGELPEQPQNEAMHWGNVLEGPVANEFASRTGFDIYVPPVPEGAVSGAVRSELWPFMMANLDRYIAEPGADEWCGILECKTGGPHVASHWGDDPPDRVLIQVQHQLAVTGFDRAFVAVLIAGQAYQDYEIARDDAVIAELVELEREFWERVERRIPPPADGSDSAGRALRRMYDYQPQTKIELPAACRPMIDTYQQLGTRIGQLEDQRAALGQQLKQELGDHHIGTIDGRKAIAWPRWTQKRFDTDRFKSEHPDLYAEYQADDDHRGRLDIPKAKA